MFWGVLSGIKLVMEGKKQKEDAKGGEKRVTGLSYVIMSHNEAKTTTNYLVLQINSHLS